MAKIDQLYQALLQHIHKQGREYKDPRRQCLRREVPHWAFVYPMREGFPLLTIKHVPFQTLITELIWFMQGRTDIDFLHQWNVHIWDGDLQAYQARAQREGKPIPKDLGRIYGKQWRDFQGVDQLGNLIQELLRNPLDTRHLVVAWNPVDLTRMALPPCHWAFEVITYTIEQGQLAFDLKWHQRSVDTLLGLPFNIASYAALGVLLEEITGYRFGHLIGDLSHVHVYGPHLEAMRMLLTLDPTLHPAPRIQIAPDRVENIRAMGAKALEQLGPKDFTLEGYAHQAKLALPLITPL